MYTSRHSDRHHGSDSPDTSTGTSSDRHIPIHQLGRPPHTRLRQSFTRAAGPSQVTTLHCATRNQKTDALQFAPSKRKSAGRDFPRRSFPDRYGKRDDEPNIPIRKRFSLDDSTRLHTGEHRWALPRGCDDACKYNTHWHRLDARKSLLLSARRFQVSE